MFGARERYIALFRYSIIGQFHIIPQGYNYYCIILHENQKTNGREFFLFSYGL